MPRSNRSGPVLFKTLIALCWVPGVPPLRSCAQVAVTDGTKVALSQPTSTGSQTSTARPRPVIPAGRRSVGLALEGGGALGLAHVGVLAWMSQHHVPVDRIAETSMGALVGSLFASGATPEQVEQLAQSDVFSIMFAVKPSLQQLSFRRRQDRMDLPQALTFGLRRGNFTLGTGLITDGSLNVFLTGQLASYNNPELDFDNLPIPFRCVSTDLTTLRPLIFRSGSLPFAVRSSISIPGVFPPTMRDGDVLVDGAIVDNLPTDVLRKDLHADVIIAVHLADASFLAKDATGISSIFGRAFQAGTSRNEEISRTLADIEILPAVSTFSSTDYSKAAVLMKAGFEAAEAQRDLLLPLALNDADLASYLTDLQGGGRKPPGLIESVRLEGPSLKGRAILQHEADRLRDLPFDEPKTEALVSGVRGGGALDAYYSTFQTGASPGSASAAIDAPPDNGILIHLRPNGDGPPYLLFSTDVVAMNANVTNTVFNMRLVDQNIASYGSELRTDVQAGYLTHLRTEYHQPLGSSLAFIEPHIEYLRQPVYLWIDQKRISERLLQRAGGGLDLGLTLSPRLQVSAQYRISTLRWVLKEGADLSPNQHVSGTAETFAGHLLYTNRSAEIASPTGTHVDLSAGYLLHGVSSVRTPFLLLESRRSLPLSKKDLLVFSGTGETYFRHDVADPLRFTLGGPLRLSASSIDEYRGTDVLLVQSTYLHQVARLPTGLGQGIYLASAYEAGFVWSPEQRSILRQDGVAGLLLNTPIGALTFGGALGDAGHRKVFFNLGKLF